MGAEYIFNLLRKMFYFLDRIIYGFIDEVYNLVIQLAGTNIFTTELINSFAERIYAFIGIFMLFKVTISLITHVFYPDDFTDKDKGFTSIIKRIILSLVMIVLVPYVFAEAYEFQKLILTENTLVTLIFGTPPETSGTTSQLAGSAYVDTAGKKIQFTLLSAFLHPNYEEFTATSNNSDVDLSPCKELYVKDSGGNYQFRAINSVSGSGNSLFHYELNPACFGEYNPDEDIYTGKYTGTSGEEEAALAKAFGDDKVLFQTYAQGVSQQDYDLTFKKGLVELEKDGKYTMSYMPLISTVVGVIALYMLVLFCIDIAVRSIKLGFLQMIAPIPIISYIDPKSGKDGMFKKWTGMCVKTYLDLFIRLFALFFGIYIISLIGTFKSVFSGETITDGIINVFLIIGVLIFIKKLPEILKDSLGLEGGTFKDFKLNPLKRIEEDAIGGKAILAGGKGLVAGTAAGLAAAGANAILAPGKGGRFFGGIAGFTSAFSKGLAGGIKGEKFGKNFANSYGAAMKNKMSRADRIDDGVKWSEMMISKAQQNLGMHTEGERAKSVSDNIDAFQKAYDIIKNAAVGSDSASWTSSTTGKTYQGAKEIQKMIDAMGRAPSADNFDLSTATGQAAYQTALRNYNAQKQELEEALEERIREIAKDRNLDDGASGAKGGRAAQAAVNDAVAQMTKLQGEINSGGRDIDEDFAGITTSASADVVGAYKQSKGAKTQFTGSGEYAHSQDVDKYARSKDQK